MRNFLDGAASFGAALFTLLVCGGPVVFTVMAVRAELVPVWGYAFAVCLAAIGLILTVAFLRKGIAGVAPSRQRRR
jgi:protein-S-isoprenylcysteine O-methyltransferase Ste14